MPPFRLLRIVVAPVEVAPESRRGARFAQEAPAPRDGSRSWRAPAALRPHQRGTRRSSGRLNAASGRRCRRYSAVGSRVGMRRVCAEGSVKIATLSGRLRPRLPVYRNSRRTRSTLARCCVKHSDWVSTGLFFGVFTPYPPASLGTHQPPQRSGLPSAQVAPQQRLELCCAGSRLPVVRCARVDGVSR